MDAYEKEVYTSLNRGKRSFCDRFNDTKDASFRNGSNKINVMSKTPSDLIATVEGVTFYLEVKHTKNEDGVTASLFKEQVAKRKRILSAGGIYKYYVYSEVLKNWFIIDGEYIDEKATRKWIELENRGYKYEKKGFKL